MSLLTASGVHSNDSMNTESLISEPSIGDTERVELCYACAGRASSTIYPEVTDPLTLESFRVVACSECGLAFTLPRPREIERYYPSKYRSYRPIVCRLLHASYAWRVKKWVKVNTSASSVLEIGCGPGLMLDAFRRLGWRVMGIERNQDAAEIGRRALGLEIVSTPIEQFPSDARFDLILMFHVLEHVQNPLELLRECAARLSPKGVLIISVPNFSSWQSHFAGAKWFHLDVPRHLTHFTAETLSLTLGRAGLQPNSISFASLEHDPFGWIESVVSHATQRMNTLSRFLMDVDKFDLKIAVAFLLGSALIVPALLLAGISWFAKRGAVIEITSAPIHST